MLRDIAHSMASEVSAKLGTNTGSTRVNEPDSSVHPPLVKCRRNHHSDGLCGQAYIPCHSRFPEADQSLGVGLDHLRMESLATGADRRNRAA